MTSNIYYVIYHRKIFIFVFSINIMTTVEEHEKIIKEFLDDINEKIRANLLIERQKIIGFAASEAAVNLFALLLRKKALVEPGFNANHRFFASQRIAEKRFMKLDIPKKGELINLLIDQESYRNKLCYGKDKKANLVNFAIENLFKIKNLIDSVLEEKNDRTG